jgi:hypothetical protein
MATNETDDLMIARLAGFIEDIKKKTYREAFENGRQAGRQEAKDALAAGIGHILDNFDEAIALNAREGGVPGTEEVSFTDFVDEVLAAIRERAIVEPDGVVPEDLGIADVKRVRQAFRQLTMVSLIRRVEKGRYLPVEIAQPQEEAAAE